MMIFLNKYLKPCNNKCLSLWVETCIELQLFLRHFKSKRIKYGLIGYKYIEIYSSGNRQEDSGGFKKRQGLSGSGMKHQEVSGSYRKGQETFLANIFLYGNFFWDNSWYFLTLPDTSYCFIALPDPFLRLSDISWTFLTIHITSWHFLTLPDPSWCFL